MYYVPWVEAAPCVGALLGTLRVLLVFGVACLRVDGRIGMGGQTWVESMSTEKTRAPSFASNAARGRPTTSDLCSYISQCWYPVR